MALGISAAAIPGSCKVCSNLDRRGHPRRRSGNLSVCIVCMTVADAFDGSERDMSRRSVSIKRSELPDCSLREEYCCDSILPPNCNTAAREARLS